MSFLHFEGILEAARCVVPEQSELKLNLAGHSVLRVLTALLVRCIFSSLRMCNSSCFASQQTAIKQMRSFKSQANSDRYSANTHTLYRHMLFPATFMTLWRGRIFLKQQTNKQALILMPKWCFLRRAKLFMYLSFF